MRLDYYLSQINCISRSKAKSLIDEGCVTVDDKIVKKPSFEIDETAEHIVSVDDSANPYVSRGGLKLKGALDAFKVDVKDKVCADIGASTGGFTDCLLKHGAKRVYAVDSGTDQLVNTLKCDPRVVSMEKFNARDLRYDTFGELCSIAVADLSFISQTYVLEGIAAVLENGGEYIGLIKPQFECGRAAIGKGGIVKKATDHLYAIERVTDFAVNVGFEVMNVILSPIRGGDGNREFLMYAVKNTSEPMCRLSKSQLSALTREK